MEVVDTKWMFVGAAAIATVSSLLFSVGVMNPLVPMPFYLVMLAWILSYGFVVVLPLVYLIEFKLLSKRENLGVLVLIIASLFSVLSIIYFWGFWEYGVKYQGKMHTQVVAAENIVDFIALVVLAYLGMSRKSKVLQYSANLLLFLLLSWCAFPYLGELP
ncbi:MAG: hypothetical protein IPK65_01195 [Gammaproteobacteria bacterium]|nr:hypothetical protein [Gammaproteobacteria bacterium]